MKKIIVCIISLFLLALFSPAKSHAALCTAHQLAQNAKVFSQSDGKCYQSTGLGFNTLGGQYICGPVACPAPNSSSPRGSTCIFPQDKGSGVQCFTGYSTKIYGGFAPSDADGGCKWNSDGDGSPITCPTAINVTVKVQSPSGTPLANVPIQFYDNGHGLINYPGGTKNADQPFLSDASGTITVSSWSGDHFKIWGVDSSSYSFDKNAAHPYDIMINNTDIPTCGWQGQSPCVIVATAGGGGGGGPTPSNGASAKAKVVLFLPAVGGKNGGNASPHRPTRNVTLYFYQANQDPTDPSITPITKTGTVTLDGATGSQTYGYFVNATLDVGNLSGTYKVLVKSNQYLRKQFIAKNGDTNQTYAFTVGQTTTLPTITLIAGDDAPAPVTAGGSYGDNTLDISDYNMLARQCYGNKSSCPNKEGADLNDDGKIDGIDYNILLRSFNILAQQGSQGGDGE